MQKNYNNHEQNATEEHTSPQTWSGKFFSTPLSDVKRVNSNDFWVFLESLPEINSNTNIQELVCLKYMPDDTMYCTIAPQKEWENFLNSPHKATQPIVTPQATQSTTQNITESTNTIKWTTQPRIAVFEYAETPTQTCTAISTALDVIPAIRPTQVTSVVCFPKNTDGSPQQEHSKNIEQNTHTTLNQSPTLQPLHNEQSGDEYQPICEVQKQHSF